MKYSRARCSMRSASRDSSRSGSWRTPICMTSPSSHTSPTIEAPAVPMRPGSTSWMADRSFLARPGTIIQAWERCMATSSTLHSPRAGAAGFVTDRSRRATRSTSFRKSSLRLGPVDGALAHGPRPPQPHGSSLGHAGLVGLNGRGPPVACGRACRWSIRALWSPRPSAVIARRG